MNPLLRRLLTRLLVIIPAVIVILVAGEEKVDSLIIFSQVIVRVQLGFAVIPLIHFVSDKVKMGAFSISPFIKALSWGVASLLVYLNIKLVLEEAAPFFSQSGHEGWKILIVLAGLAALPLFLYIIFHPCLICPWQRRAFSPPPPDPLQLHPPFGAPTTLSPPPLPQLFPPPSLN